MKLRGELRKMGKDPPHTPEKARISDPIQKSAPLLKTHPLCRPDASSVSLILLLWSLSLCWTLIRTESMMIKRGPFLVLMNGLWTPTSSAAWLPSSVSHILLLWSTSLCWALVPEMMVIALAHFISDPILIILHPWTPKQSYRFQRLSRNLWGNLLKASLTSA